MGIIRKNINSEINIESGRNNPQKVKKHYEIIVSHPCTTYFFGNKGIDRTKTETIIDEKVTVYGYKREALSKATEKIMQYKDHLTTQVRIYDVENHEFLT